jgi:hypothetical protein
MPSAAYIVLCFTVRMIELITEVLLERMSQVIGIAEIEPTRQVKLLENCLIFLLLPITQPRMCVELDHSRFLNLVDNLVTN